MKTLLYTLPLLIFSLFILIIFPKTSSPDIVKFLYLSQAILLVYLFFLYLVKKVSFSFQTHKKLAIYLIVIGIILRLSISFLTGEQSYLSDDVYRYIFEGNMVSHHYNPFILSPDDMVHSTLADTTIFPKINHPWHVTIYPPVAQYLFASASLMSSNSLIGFKLLSLLFELLSLYLLFCFIRKYELPDWTYCIYLFSPLILIEFLFSIHLDIFGLPFLLGILILLKEKKPKVIILGILVAVATLIKFYILFFLPFIFFYINNRSKFKFVVSFILTTLILYLPFILSSGVHIFGSLFEYLDTWQYNGSLFLLLKDILSQEIARYICYGLFFISYIPLLLLKRFKQKYMLQSFLIFLVYVIVTPTLFNWYLLWIIPFVIYFRSISFIVFSGTCMLSYHVLIGYYTTGVWSQMPILTVVSYLPFFALLIFEIYKHLKNQKVIPT